MSEENDYNTIAEDYFNSIKKLIELEESTQRDNSINDAYNELITNVYYAKYVGNGKYKSNCLGNLRSNNDLRNDIIGSSDYDAAKSLIIEKIDNHKNCKKNTHKQKHTERLAKPKKPNQINGDENEYTFEPTSYTNKSYINANEDNAKKKPAILKSDTKPYEPKETTSSLLLKKQSAEMIEEREKNSNIKDNKDMKNRTVLTQIRDIDKKNANLMENAKERQEAIEEARKARKAQEENVIPGGKTKKRRKNKSKRRRRRTLRANKSKKRPSKKGRKTRK